MSKIICHISPVSIHSTRWIEAFHKKGYNVSLVTDSQTWVAQRPRNVPTYFLPTLVVKNAQRRLFPNCISILKILRTIKPDLVHLHEQHHYAPFVRCSNVSYILHSWGSEVLDLSNTTLFRKTVAKYAAKKARKIIVDAECMKQIWASFGIPRGKIEVIPFGVDTNIFKPRVGGNEIRKQFGIGADDIVVISTRPFFPHYNIECLIQAIPQVRKRHKNVRFIIKGRGPLKNQLKEMVSTLNIAPYVRFSGQVPYEEMPQYLTAANIYVSTSTKDSTSVSLLEAMACGLPPIVADIAGNREWIKNQSNGLLYPQEDHKALADKILNLIEHEDLRKDFGRRNREIIASRAEWSKCVARMESIYQSIT